MADGKKQRSARLVNLALNQIETDNSSLNTSNRENIFIENKSIFTDKAVNAEGFLNPLVYVSDQASENSSVKSTISIIKIRNKDVPRSDEIFCDSEYESEDNCQELSKLTNTDNIPISVSECSGILREIESEDHYQINQTETNFEEKDFSPSDESDFDPNSAYMSDDDISTEDEYYDDQLVKKQMHRDKRKCENTQNNKSRNMVSRRKKLSNKIQCKEDEVVAPELQREGHEVVSAKIQIESPEGASPEIPKDSCEQRHDYKKMDEISLVVKNDPLILAYGSRLLKKKKERRSRKAICSKMRDLATLLIVLRKKDHRIEILTDVLDPEKYDIFIDGIKNMCGFDEETGFVKVTSIPARMRPSILGCIDILYTRSTMSTESTAYKDLYKKKLDDFKRLVEINWEWEISSNAEKTRKRKNMTKENIIPLEEDIATVMEKIHKLEAKYAQRLSKNRDALNYEHLCTVTIAHIIMLD
ncbi:unnamed protein product [Parnassius apollo]|uniref:(apollo) hypothetical protein n=1 Tax=Parnassius apollo TaxID=110799 RepID=A0A8S3W3A2_PARAO|nr:unnamed protein product [Parnassius apollo]